MDKKSTVGKSKSSNSAIVSRMDGGGKKCSSNNEIKPNLIKKRGVYVEKTIKPDADNVPQKPPKRRRSEQKKFLASVLNILSKSTAGTQYPEYDNTDILEPRSVQKKETKKSRRTKYKSRILNKEQKEDEEIIVLKSRKYMISNSPSTFSDRSKDVFNCSEVAQDEPKKNSIKNVVENNVYSGVAEGPARDVLKTTRNKKKLRVQEPISEVENDKKMYNFFVDLLETTFNIYDVKDGVQCETAESKTRLVVDESVAQKLVIKNDQKSCCTNDMDTEKNLFLNSFNEKRLNVKISDHNPPKVRTKVTKAYPYTRKPKATKSKIVDVPQKTGHTRKPKKALLDILKEQLRRDAYTFEEPQNLYQALRVMAKNKKKCERAIHYTENRLERFDGKQCMFRRKVLLKSKKRNRKPEQRIPKLGSRSFEVDRYKNFSSYHSLKVIGYDYEEPMKKPIDGEHNIWFSIHPPSSSISESDVYCSTVEV